MIKWSGSWKFWDYVSLGGNNMIEEWRQQDLSDGARFLFDKLIKNIQKTENHLNWLGFRKFIKRNKDKVWELGFSSDGRAYRVLGDFCGEKQAVLLIGCYHKEGNYTPPDSIELAFTRKALLKNGTATHEERKISIY
jgi:phage-related protein